MVIHRNAITVNILLVEDNQADADLAIEALKDAKVTVDLSVVDDGEKAINYLYQKGEYAQATRPDLILLDLNLPKLDGREVLAKIKSDPALMCLPVVVLTTSDSEQDVAKMYSQHANCYIKKPVDFDQFYNAITEVTDFWFNVVKLPPLNCSSR
jgi:chemotaxis family two-component system response regulator Rcp1